MFGEMKLRVMSIWKRLLTMAGNVSGLGDAWEIKERQPVTFAQNSTNV
jgi:hypothetical protein